MWKLQFLLQRVPRLDGPTPSNAPATPAAAPPFLCLSIARFGIQAIKLPSEPVERRHPGVRERAIEQQILEHGEFAQEREAGIRHQPARMETPQGRLAAARFDGATCVDARVTLQGVATAPQSLEEAERRLRGERWTDSLLNEVVEEAYRSAHPMDNTAGAIALRRRAVRSLTRQALTLLTPARDA